MINYIESNSMFQIPIFGYQKRIGNPFVFLSLLSHIATTFSSYGQIPYYIFEYIYKNFLFLTLNGKIILSK